MKYNAKYDRWFTKEGLVFRYVKSQDRLVLCKLSKTVYGYEITQSKEGLRFVHRMLWETFNCEIPNGYEIDHINTVRDDNRLENLRCVTPRENRNNELTLKHISESQKGRKHTEKTKHEISISLSDKSRKIFISKFKEHYRN